jgi:hypothetical protein
MAAVGGTCGAAAIGLFRGARWGRLLGLLILSANLVGDAANAILRHDYRPLIGRPVGGAMIVYLWSTTCRKV